jgi:alpha-1,3-rhamnosyl/mannosyltransferase
MALWPDTDPERIRIIPYGVGDEFRPCTREAVAGMLERRGLPERYVLFVGTIEPRKNLEVLVEAYRRLVLSARVAEHLVLAGQLGWGFDTLLRRLDADDLRGRVHLTGYLPRVELPLLYSGARVFVYPSLYEGFGFPPLEAMACGVPTLASASSSLVDNLRDAAELIPTGDAAAMAAALERLLGDDRTWQRQREKGLARAATFRWEQTAIATLQCYRDLAARGWDG